MKNLLVVLALLALAILIEFLIEGPVRKQDMVNIVGCETDSVGGSYIYFDNGDIYHRRGKSHSASPLYDLENLRNPRIHEANDNLAAEPGPFSQSE